MSDQPDRPIPHPWAAFHAQFRREEPYDERMSWTLYDMKKFLVIPRNRALVIWKFPVLYPPGSPRPPVKNGTRLGCGGGRCTVDGMSEPEVHRPLLPDHTT
jgi:hypothetical protein